jgi:formylglycine-generating enzyme
MNDDGAPSGAFTSEWTSDWLSAGHEVKTASRCCQAENSRGAPEEGSYDGCRPNIRIPRKVLKGWARLCAPCCCRRYRSAARHAQSVDTSASHVGFRSMVRGPYG